jgi:PAS domain S-box-containing protein
MSGTMNLQDGSPLIYLSGENDRMALISNINLSACRIFGFLRKEELLGKNVKVLMPHIYSRNHDEFIRNAILKSAE